MRRGNPPRCEPAQSPSARSAVRAPAGRKPCRSAQDSSGQRLTRRISQPQYRLPCAMAFCRCPLAQSPAALSLDPSAQYYRYVRLTRWLNRWLSCSRLSCLWFCFPAAIAERIPRRQANERRTSPSPTAPRSVHLASYRGQVVLLNFWCFVVRALHCRAALRFSNFTTTIPNLVDPRRQHRRGPGCLRELYSQPPRRSRSLCAIPSKTAADLFQPTCGLRPTSSTATASFAANSSARPTGPTRRSAPSFEASKSGLGRGLWAAASRHLLSVSCYHFSMTTVDILFRYATPPTEAAAFALASAREVYGIRRLVFDRAERTLRVEYDATRLNAASVAKLVRQAGLDIEEEVSLIPPQPAPNLRPRPDRARLQPSPMPVILYSGSQPCAPVAQLDRATDYESVGREFESLRAHHKNGITSGADGGALFLSARRRRSLPPRKSMTSY